MGFDGKEIEKRKMRLGVSDRDICREADDLSTNTLKAVFGNHPKVRVATINRVIRALDRLEANLAPRLKSKAAG